MNLAPIDEPNPVTHQVRASALERETIWSLQPDGLHWQTEGCRAQSEAYKNMVEIRLRFAPTPADHQRYCCEIKTQGGRGLTIVSTHYVGLARFEDRGATYGSLVRELIARVKQARPAVRLWAGMARPVYYRLMASIGLAGMLLIWAVGLPGAGSEMSTGSWVRVAGMLLLVSLTWSFFKVNRPRDFSAEDIPAELLPHE